MRFRLRTLMIVLALGPPIGAGGYWAWEQLQSKKYLTEDDFPEFFLPQNKPGHHWKMVSMPPGLIEVPNEPTD